MAKTTSKAAAKAPKKAPAKTTKAKISSADLIETVSVEALKALKTLNIEQELQNDIEWCLGSYRSDKNPVGLYAMNERVLKVLEEEKTKKSKGVTTKLLTDLKKVLERR